LIGIDPTPVTILQQLPLEAAGLGGFGQQAQAPAGGRLGGEAWAPGRTE
jgi:hypothetical protein